MSELGKSFPLNNSKISNDLDTKVDFGNTSFPAPLAKISNEINKAKEAGHHVEYRTYEGTISSPFNGELNSKELYKLAQDYNVFVACSLLNSLLALGTVVIAGPEEDSAIQVSGVYPSDTSNYNYGVGRLSWLFICDESDHPHIFEKCAGYIRFSDNSFINLSPLISDEEPISITLVILDKQAEGSGE